MFNARKKRQFLFFKTPGLFTRDYGIIQKIKLTNKSKRFRKFSKIPWILNKLTINIPIDVETARKTNII